MTIQTNLIRHSVKSGLTFELTPLTLLGQQHFKDRAKELYPDPDPTPYEHPMPDAFIEGDKTAAKDDPAYRKLLAETTIRRDFAYQVLVLNTCVTCEGREVLVERYLASNQTGLKVLLGALAALEVEDAHAAIEPAWVQLLYMSLCDNSEINEMLALIQGKLPLEAADSVGGFAYFQRMAIPRNVSARGTTEESASGSTAS